MSFATLVRPKATRAAMTRQLELVVEYASLREERAAEVVSQIPQLLTYWTSVIGLHANRTKWTLELLAAAIRLAISVEMRFKHAMAFPRPVQFSPQVQPMILTPQHSSYPSGHSTEAHTAAELLVHLIGSTQGGDMRPFALRKLAARMASNRTVAGVHFPVDSWAGLALGTSLAEYVVARCSGAPVCRPRRFVPKEVMDQDFVPPAIHGAGKAVKGIVVGNPKLLQTPSSQVLGWLWGKAKQEWR